MEQMEGLVGFPAPPSAFLEGRFFFRAETNVLPLALGDEKALPPRRFTGREAYFLSERLQEIAYVHGRWSLRYGYGLADLYEGNGGAAQLYLNAKAGILDDGRNYSVAASLGRSALHRWTVEHRVPLRWLRAEGEAHFVLHWLRTQRLQQGSLVGRMATGQFLGNLRLLTTRGLPAGEVRSNGLAMDWALLASMGKGWRMGLWLENALGRLWQGALQDIQAQVATNTLEPDANEFLHAVPFLQGQVQRTSSVFKVQRRWSIGLARRQREEAWLALLQSDGDWRWGLGYVYPLGRGRSLWLMAQGWRWQWQGGIFSSRWHLHLGMDRWPPSSAQRVQVSLGWSF